MKESILKAVVGVCAAVACLASAAPASAQLYDHMRCFKVKDEAKFAGTVSLTAFQTQFGVADNCRIKGKGKLFCVPVDKQVVEFEDKSKDGIAQLPVFGDELVDDRICYKVKCPKQDIAAEAVSDQFGARMLSGFKTQYLCTPALKGTVTTSTTTTTTLPVDECDPVAQDCAAGGQACYAFDGGVDQCLTSGVLGPGATCAENSACLPGLGCIADQCRQYCNQTPDCSVGSCATVIGLSVGACIPT